MGRRHGGKGAGRNPSMRRRIFRNSSLGTATSVNWKVTYRPRAPGLPFACVMRIFLVKSISYANSWKV